MIYDIVLDKGLLCHIYCFLGGGRRISLEVDVGVDSRVSCCLFNGMETGKVDATCYLQLCGSLCALCSGESQLVVVKF